MNKIELIVFSIIAVIATAVSFDFVIYILKSAPKSAYFYKRTWAIGFLCIIALVYWYLNGMKFLYNCVENPSHKLCCEWVVHRHLAIKQKSLWL